MELPSQGLDTLMALNDIKFLVENTRFDIVI